jgi:hypothetical protein
MTQTQETLTLANEAEQIARKARILAIKLELSKLSQAARFVSVTYRSKESGEVARHTLIIGASYLKRLEAGILSLSLWTPEDKAELIKGDICLPVINKAIEELAASFQNSLDNAKQGKFNDNYTKAETYVPICTGMKENVNDGSLEIWGWQHAKAVITPGVFKTVKSRPLTLAKEAIRRKLGLKFRTLCVDMGNLVGVKLNGEIIELE